MRKLSAALAALVVLAAQPALAKRTVTDKEHDQLLSALKAQNCSGGKMEFDDGRYEVEEAQCGDGKTYDLEFDVNFQFMKKKLER